MPSRTRRSSPGVRGIDAAKLKGRVNLGTMKVVAITA